MKIKIFIEGLHHKEITRDNPLVFVKPDWINNHSQFMLAPDWNSSDFIFFMTAGEGDLLNAQVNSLRTKYKNKKPILFVYIGPDTNIVPIHEDNNIYLTTCFNKESKLKYQHSAAYTCGLVNWDIHRQRSILACFNGSSTTWEPRELLKNIESENIKINFTRDNWWDLTTEEKTKNKELFENSMYNSLFSLCPRGRAPSSMRLVESILRGCIPVTINDDTQILDDNLDFCVRTSIDKIHNLENELLRIRDNKEELKYRLESMEHFIKTKLCTNPDSHITYADFIYNKCKSYLTEN